MKRRQTMDNITSGANDSKAVIIPTYNEKENIENIIRAVFGLAGEYHIVIIDDGSPDGTADIVKSLRKEFPDRLFLIEREGKLGLEPLVGEIVVTGGSDGLKAHIYPDPEYVEKKKMNPQKVHDELQKILDHYNRRQPTYKQIVALEVRDQPFVKSSTRKIKRNLVED